MVWYYKNKIQVNSLETFSCFPPAFSFISFKFQFSIQSQVRNKVIWSNDVNWVLCGTRMIITIIEKSHFNQKQIQNKPVMAAIVQYRNKKSRFLIPRVYQWPFILLTLIYAKVEISSFICYYLIKEHLNFIFEE